MECGLQQQIGPHLPHFFNSPKITSNKCYFVSAILDIMNHLFSYLTKSTFAKYSQAKIRH